MPLWRICPAPFDLTTARLDYGKWSEVVVRADSAAQARVMASAELDDRSDVIGNESAAGQAGLEDVKLYHVARLPDDATGAFPADKGQKGVIWASREDTSR